MQTNIVKKSDYIQNFREILQKRIVEILKAIKAYEYIEKDRGLLPYEKRNNKSLGENLTINENILKIIDPDYIGIQ